MKQSSPSSTRPKFSCLIRYSLNFLNLIINNPSFSNIYLIYLYIFPRPNPTQNNGFTQKRITEFLVYPVSSNPVEILRSLQNRIWRIRLYKKKNTPHRCRKFHMVIKIGYIILYLKKLGCFLILPNFKFVRLTTFSTSL